MSDAVHPFGSDAPHPESSPPESSGSQDASGAADHPHVLRLGCVSFLNAKPLIEGASYSGYASVHYDVPSRLLDDLLQGRFDVALCPVMDLFLSPEPLRIVPAGCIGCDGPTYTVRLYSRVPIEQVQTIYADTDSHTSVALLQLLFRMRFGRTPKLIDYHARERVAEGKIVDNPEAMLLIGDKVVTDSPPAVTYPHQLDLGEAWKQQTGLPFVFAVWMTREGTDLGDLPERMSVLRQRNLHPERLGAIVERHAPVHGWPTDLAYRYLGEILQFDFDQAKFDAVRSFADRLVEHHMLTHPRELSLYPCETTLA